MFAIILKVGLEELVRYEYAKVKIIPHIWSMINFMIFFKSGLGEVMTLFDDNPTILE